MHVRRNASGVLEVDFVTEVSDPFFLAEKMLCPSRESTNYFD